MDPLLEHLAIRLKRKDMLLYFIECENNHEVMTTYKPPLMEALSEGHLLLVVVEEHAIGTAEGGAQRELIQRGAAGDH